MSARPWARGAVAAALTLLTAACGGTPTDPGTQTPPGTIDVAGSWAGTWTFTVAGAMVTDDVSVTLSQSGGAATGTWTGESGATGQLSLNATAAVSGNVTINQATLGGGSCNATTPVQGTASPNRLDLTLGDIEPQGICQWGKSGRFVLTR